MLAFPPPFSNVILRKARKTGRGWMGFQLCLFEHEPRVNRTHNQAFGPLFGSALLLWHELLLGFFLKALLRPSSVFHFQISETWQLCTHSLLPWHILQRHERDWTADKMRMFTSCKRLRWEVLCAIKKMARFHQFLHTNYHTLAASTPSLHPRAHASLPLTHTLAHKHTHAQ